VPFLAVIFAGGGAKEKSSLPAGALGRFLAGPHGNGNKDIKIPLYATMNAASNAVGTRSRPRRGRMTTTTARPIAISSPIWKRRARRRVRMASG